MTKKNLATCLFSACLFLGLHAQVSEINWQPTQLLIDGNPNDWTTQLRFFDSNSKIKYEFRNDANNLYFVFKSDEKLLQRQIEQAGMKLKFVVEGKPKVNATIELNKKEGFRGMPAPPEGMMQPGQFQNGNRIHDAQTLGKQPNMAENPNNEKLEELSMRRQFTPIDTAYTKGFLYNRDIAISEDKSGGVITFAKSNRGMEESAFELVIPLRELFGENYQLSNISNHYIQFQLVINALSQSSDRGSFRGMRGSGGMGGPGGGMGGPGGGMGGPGGGMGGPGGGMGGGSEGGPGGEMGERPDMQGDSNQASANTGKKTIKATIQLTTEQ